ncbi:MBL fold metallo-hydrolase [Roseomonas marmotae]|uniref:MBL fold metallo-hydrolase n=1 Tax=Roseomonas marmotae TaxID=2768161 RepID=A0ABS3K7K6_9PROT|nr:MBL fold metallo-hydrolase [Roseomonas marmotae]MBO1073451.1 MBL fold metallo-hydrolase [Roseomonas marmotae]QTI80353.1 MBL fold metallo-hydrolase [Roseomonas marmotae]
MQQPEPGETTQILPGLHWVRVPLPFPPGHVNCWLLRDGEGWLLIDAGAQVKGAVQDWQRIFAEALDGRPITRVLVTHFHYDHVGLAGWMCDHWQAPLLMSRTEYLMTRMLLAEDSETLGKQQRELGRQAGAPESYFRHLAGRRPLYRTEVTPVPPQHQRLAAGDTLVVDGRPWQVRIGQGHAPEMICLHSPDLDVLIGADQILPRISPYIGVVSWEPDGDPLEEFLRSLATFRDLPAETLVLPSHGAPFTGLHDRIAALEAHHAERLDTLTRALTEPMTIYEASRVLFPRVTEDSQTGFVIGEGLAHLTRLVKSGILLREASADGLPRYRRTPEALLPANPA